MLRRTSYLISALAIVVLLVAEGGIEAGAKNNQMVKGTIKSVDAGKDVLVVNQKVKNELVDRELSILNTTEFVVNSPKGSKTAVGNAGLLLLEGKEGSPVQVKCDKDVNVLKVTVTVK